jgi:heterodisulfide reductase subunit A
VDEPVARIGVFVCDCGHKISDFIDNEALVENAAALPGVILARCERYTCSKAGLKRIQAAIAEQGLSRVVVAGCTPRTHELLFRKACEEAGLNGALFEMVNIREQCAWVHGDKTQATDKAIALVRMGVARAALLEPRAQIEGRVTPAVLVIGGGTAGLTAILAVASGGVPVTLVERENELGGLVNKLHSLDSTGRSAHKFISVRIEAVRGNPGITVLTGAHIAAVDGSPGDYHIAVQHNGHGSTLDAGAIIVATGAQPSRPRGLFGYGRPRVITQFELESLLDAGEVTAQDIVMILCEPEEHPHCDGLCCMTILKNAILLKKTAPERRVIIIFSELPAGEPYANWIKEARRLGVSFVRYTADRKPHVGRETVEVYDALTATDVNIPYDLVVLSKPLVARDDAPVLANMLRLPQDDNGFFPDMYTRLKPRDYADDGIYVCGSAHYPANTTESMFQAYNAASRALRYVADETVSSQAAVAAVDERLCTGCGTCVETCPFAAIAMEKGEGVLSLSRIDPLRCAGCGNCVVACPSKAITLQSSTDQQVMAQIHAALTGPTDGQPRILGLLCQWSGYAAADLAGARHLSYPSNVRFIRVRCSARLDPYHILWALLNGADGILLAACEPGECHYTLGNQYAEERIKGLQRMLAAAGFDTRRLWLEWFKPDDAPAFVSAVTAFVDQIEKLGPARQNS